MPPEARRLVASERFDETARNDELGPVGRRGEDGAAARHINPPAGIHVPVRVRPVEPLAGNEIGHDDHVAWQRQHVAAMLERLVAVVRRLEVVEGGIRLPAANRRAGGR